MPLSGPQWVNQFAASSSTNDLAEPFRSRVNRFLAALRAAGAHVIIDETLRPPQRAHLMHYAFRIARENLDPTAVPPMQGVEIQWVHRGAQGQPDAQASRHAAEQMVRAYDIVFRPALTSRHTEGNAIDMTISWQGTLNISDARGTQTAIATPPRNGGNGMLQQIGAGYGVHKLATDPPHWSSDGH